MRTRIREAAGIAATLFCLAPVIAGANCDYGPSAGRMDESPAVSSAVPAAPAGQAGEEPAVIGTGTMPGAGSHDGLIFSHRPLDDILGIGSGYRGPWRADSGG